MTSDQTLLTLLDAVVRRHTDRPAVSFATARWTYGQIDAWSSRVAAALREIGVRPGDRVALSLAPSDIAIAAILGVLRSGAAYVPLDVRNPLERNRFILKDSGAKAFITDRPDGIPADIRVLSGAQVSALVPPGVGDSSPYADPRISARNEAYVIYTSGTTGRPKGVPIHHGAVVALLAGTGEHFKFAETDRWLLFHSLAFDVSVWEIWGALSTGAELEVLSHWTVRSPRQVLDHIAERRITVLSQTPTAFGSLAAAVEESGTALPALRYLVFAGEKLLPSAVRTWAARFGLDTPNLINMYGITETTVHSTFHRITTSDVAGTTSVIGAPLPGFSHRVITESGADAEMGERGVLWLAGPQVSLGYVNRPDLASRFAELPTLDGSGKARYYRSGDVVSSRADGTLVYHGREDLQVKLRGYRVELADIESVLASHERVVEVVAWVHEHSPGDQRVICAYTTGEGSVPVRSLREHVHRILPAYMWPAHYTHRSEIPRTVNGKVDRARLAKEWTSNKGDCR